MKLIQTSKDYVIELNKQSGSHFFDKDTMSFFKSRLLKVFADDSVTDDRIFVTSELFPAGDRRYTIRHICEEGHVSTIGKFGEYSTARDAYKCIEECFKLLRGV